MEPNLVDLEKAEFQVSRMENGNVCYWQCGVHSAIYTNME